MRILFGFILVLLMSMPAYGQSLTKDMDLAVKYLSNVQETDRPYIKFFTYYALPTELQEDAVLATSFWIHSLTGPTIGGAGNTGYYAPLAQRIQVADKDGKSTTIFKPIQNVKVKQENGTELSSPTLYWLDIRDYNWTEKVWEEVSFDEPYILKEFINAYDYDALRILGGNAIVRADWFLAWTCDVTKRADRNLEPLYYKFLYASVKIPKTGEEYRNTWGVSRERLDDLGTVLGNVVDVYALDPKTKQIIKASEVSRNARELAGARTETGYHYESSDFKFNDGANDPIENYSIERGKDGVVRHKAIARTADAHEYITTNRLGLQVYFLTNGKEERVEFGDPTVVWDRRDLTGDIRVRTARSCVVCHSAGLNPAINSLREYIENGVEIITGTKEYQQALTKFYLSEFGVKLQNDNALYARASVSTNGLLPEENARLMQKILDWYDFPVTLEQAAIECGVSTDKLVEKISPAIGARLARLGVYNNKEGKKSLPIPRHLWDNPKGGQYVQAMSLVYRTEVLPVTSQTYEKENPPPSITTLYLTPVKIKNDVVGHIQPNTKLEYIKKADDWYQIKYNDKLAYIYGKHVKEN